MRKNYCCDAYKSLYTDYYVNQAGNGIPVFQGMRGQRGHGFGSVLSGLFRSAMPVLKRIGKQALTTGAYIASDLLGGKSFDESARSRVRQGINSFLPPEEGSEQTGSGHKRRKAIYNGKRKRKVHKPKGKKKQKRDIFD